MFSHFVIEAKPIKNESRDVKNCIGHERPSPSDPPFNAQS